MVDQRCRQCRYCGYTSVLGWTCDYLLIVGHSRTVGLTKEEKAGPCREFAAGRKIRRREGIAYSVKAHYTFDQKKIRKLYFEGLNDAEIAKAIGSTRTPVMQWRARHNLAPNVPRGYHRKENKVGEGDEVHVLRGPDPVDPGGGRQADPH